MSTFFEKLSKTAKKTANTIGTKSAEMVSTGKLKLEIKQLEGKIKDKKLEIGTAIYDAYAANEEPDLQVIGEMCGEVSEFENQIKELEQQLKSESEPAAAAPAAAATATPATAAGSPGTIICPGCGSAEKEGTSFCSQCGHKMDSNCAKCGESLKPGAKFCASCGTPVE